MHTSFLTVHVTIMGLPKNKHVFRSITTGASVISGNIAKETIARSSCSSSSVDVWGFIYLFIFHSNFHEKSLQSALKSQNATINSSEQGKNSPYKKDSQNRYFSYPLIVTAIIRLARIPS